MNIGRQRTGSTAWLIVVCASLLLVATTAQAAHFCGFQILDAHSASQLGSASSPNVTVCLTCLLAQSAVAVVVFIAFSPMSYRRVRRQAGLTRPRQLLESFQMYVRPPPAR